MDQNNESSKVIFEEEELQRPTHSFQSLPSKIVEWVLKYSGGYVKDEKQANYVLLGIVVIAVILSLIVIFSSGAGGKTEIILSPVGDNPLLENDL